MLTIQEGFPMTHQASNPHPLISSNPHPLVTPASRPVPCTPPTFETYRRRLPHWRQDGATYFVTWRVRPHTPTLSALERDVVRETIWHFEQARFDLYASVVMNDHVHVLMTPYAGQPLSKTVLSWKSYSAKRIREVGERAGKVWQREYFDRIIRHDWEFEKTLEYIVNNPAKRWPGLDRYPWLDLTGQEAGVTSG